MQSQKQKILTHLKRHVRGITRAQAFSQYGIVELPARIIELKAQGHKIGVEMMKKGGKRFARYFLVKAAA